MIPRPSLEARLETAVRERQHVAIFASTGYGKTTLVAKWCKDLAPAWVTLDAEDADLDVFLAYLISAFERALENFDTEARGMLGRAREREGAMAALSVLLADLDEQCDRPLVLILDDYHLAASPSLDALVARLLKYLPEPIRLVLVSRQQPDIGLAALQARRRVLVLGETELRFGTDELRLLRPDLDDQGIASLLETTGGWPAAMGMPPELLEAFLEEQVLSPQPPEVRYLLQRLALVDVFDADLCESALHVSLTQERRNFLLQHRLILPHGEHRFQIQPQIRGLLRRRFLADVPREERLALLRTVGDYYWQHGQASTSLRFWVDAGEAAWAADRLAEVAEDWLRQGRIEALSSAIGALDAEADRPELLMSQGEIHRRWGNFERADQLFRAAIEGFGPAPGPTGRALAQLRQAQAAASCGRVGLAREHLAEAAPLLDDHPRCRIDVLNLEGGLELLAGSTERAIDCFERSLRLGRQVGDPYAEARSIHNLGVCYTRLGEFGRALECYEAALRPAAADGTPTIWMTPINRALVLSYLGRLEEAASAAEVALDLVRRYKLSREEGYALRILGYSQMRMGAFDAATVSFESAELLARRVNDHLGLAYSLNFRAELAVVAGDHEAAMGLSEELERTMGGLEALMGISEFVQVRAKIHLAAGHVEAASPLVDELITRARSNGYRHLLAETEQLASDLTKLKQGGQVAPAQVVVRATPPDSSAELSIRCFAGLRVLRTGQEIADREWQTARAKVLLAYLLHTPEGATKSRLFEAIYPREESTDASMNMTLARLRKALEPTLEKGRPSRYILRADGRYTFNRQVRLELDTLAFDQAVNQARRATGAEEQRLLEQAVALYSGEFLPGFDHEWVLALRHRFQDQAVEACRRLLAIYDQSDAAAANALLRRALEIDPLSEEFNRELILRYLEADEPHRALQHYQLCEQRYREFLDASPPDDLAQLVKSL